MAALHWVFIASFIWGFIALAGAFSANGMHGSLITVASLVAEHRLQARAPGTGLRQRSTRTHALWYTGFVVLQQVESSQTRDRTCVSSIGGWILIHCITREVSELQFLRPHILGHWSSVWQLLVGVGKLPLPHWNWSQNPFRHWSLWAAEGEVLDAGQGSSLWYQRVRGPTGRGPVAGSWLAMMT